MLVFMKMRFCECVRGYGSLAAAVRWGRRLLLRGMPTYHRVYILVSRVRDPMNSMVARFNLQCAAPYRYPVATSPDKTRTSHLAAIGKLKEDGLPSHFGPHGDSL